MEPRQYHIFGTVMVSVYLAFHVYIFWWLGRYFRPSRPQDRAVLFSLCVLAALFPAARYLEKGLHGASGDALVRAGFTWLGAVSILFTVCLLCDLLWLALRAFKAGRPGKPALGVAALALAAGLITLAAVRGAELPRVVPMEIELGGLPAALDGFKIVQLSDVHLGRLITVEKFRGMAARVNALEADLVVFTGDITERGAADPEGICAVIRSIKGRYGKAGVPGNHDASFGRENAAAFFEECGVKMLRFEKYEPAPGLQVAGADDPRRGARAGRGSGPLLATLDAAKALVFLSHRPDGLDAVIKAHPGLVLSGHTHEGQIYPFGLLTRPLHKYFYGLYRAGAASVYVSSGAGTWGPPMRLFTISELPLFILRSAPAR